MVQQPWPYQNSYYPNGQFPGVAAPQYPPQYPPIVGDQYPPVVNQYPMNDPAYGYMYQKGSMYPPRNYTASEEAPRPHKNKLVEELVQFKSMYVFECKQCGMLMSTYSKYENHMSEHFFQAQKAYEISHSRIEHSRKPSKPRMSTPEVKTQLFRNGQNEGMPAKIRISLFP